MSAGAYTGTPGSAEEPPDPAEQPPPSRPDGAPATAQRVSHALADGGPHRAVPIAGALRLGAGEEGLTPNLGATGRREESGGGIDVPPDDVVGDLEGTRCSGPGRRPHEIDPDGKRALGTGDPGRRAVVEARPDRSDHLGREADEPGVAGVVGRAGLAGRGAVDPGAARGARGPSVDD